MKKIKFTLFITCFHSFFSFAQHNLVPDPGFDITRAPKSKTMIYFPDMMSRDWLTMTHIGQPRDTTNQIYTRSTSILNPYYSNYPNYFQTFSQTQPLTRKITPRSYPSAVILTELYSYYKNPRFVSPGHPYIMTQLTSALKKDHYYYVEYYVKATCNKVYVSNIDLLFSTNEPGPYHCEDEINWRTPWDCKDSLRYYPASPQIKNPVNRFITDSINWTRICGVYKAKGGEKYITIGNFAHDRDTDTIPGDKRNSSGNDWYILDDVTVTELELPHNITICENQLPYELSPSLSYADYFSYTQPPGDSFTINTPGLFEYTISNEACSAQATISVNTVELLAFDIKDTVICESNTPVVFNSPEPSLPITWHNGSQAKSIQISEEGKYWMELKNVCGTHTDTFYVSLNYPPQILSPDTIVVLCKNDTLPQDLTVYAAINNYDQLLWSSGENSNEIYLTKPGTYTLTAYNDCGENKMIVEALGCPPDFNYTLFISNLITPNGDNLNDTWEVHYSNISILRVEVINSWGSTIYKSDGGNLRWEPSKEGLYFYVIEYIKPVTNEKAVEKGWVQVIK